MCGATVHQASPSRTVNPPQTAWTSTSSGIAAASQVSERRCGRARQISRNVPSEATSTTPGQRAVAELDQLVERRVLLPEDRDQRPRMAFRPGRAAQAGSGDANHRAGDRDHPVGDHGGQREAALPPVGRCPVQRPPRGAGDRGSFSERHAITAI